MSALYRKGTVSKASGPIHCNSYAMRGVVVRYKAPIFVPELLQLPGDWVKPTLPSSQTFNYDFGLERRVSAQARQRAISIAAEASLQREQIAALLKQREEEEEEEEEGGGGGGDSPNSSPPQSKPNPPLLLSSAILMPTLVAPPTSRSSPAVGDSDALATTQQSGSSSGEGGSSSSLIEDEGRPVTVSSSDQAGKSESVFKSLGNWSIKEFEGGAMDPFESTSLQAINDMEVLQSVVLQPNKPVAVVPPPASSVSSPSMVSQVPAGLNFAYSGVQSSPSNTAPVQTSAAATHAGASGALSSVRTSGAQAGPVGPVPTQTALQTSGAQALAVNPMSSNSNPELRTDTNSAPSLIPQRNISGGSVAVFTGTSPQLTSPLAQALFNPQEVPQVSTNPFLSGQVPATTSASMGGGTNPFLSSEPLPIPSHYPFTAPGPVIAATQQQQQQQGSSPNEPGVGTLVDLSGNGTRSKPPVPTPRTSPPKTHPGATPIPKPRKVSSPAVSARGVASPAITSGANSQSSPQPGSTRPPIVPPKGNVHFNHSGDSSPVAISRGVGSGSPKFPNRVSMGVAVLPPITSTSSPATPPSHTTAINEPPPVYKLNNVATPPPSTHHGPTSRKSSPPPPYSSPSTAHRHQPHALPPHLPVVAPKSYVLPNPQASLTSEQAKQTGTIAGMGFPQQRVGRAILRYEGDQTKVLDFLFLVGELEDAKFDGNSAETALITCEDDLEKAKEYLQKLAMYKEIGFQEKAIHESYSKADGNWDKILDILTRSR